MNPSPCLRFLIESSPTPIYRRITAAYQQALERQQQQVIYFDPLLLGSDEAALRHLIETIDTQAIDYILIFDSSRFITQILDGPDQAVFERFAQTLVFIHHDNVWTSLTDARRVAAWQRVRDRSLHCCLEYQNVLDLRQMGFPQVCSIPHGSEFTPVAPPTHYTHAVSFVGHVLPDLATTFERFQPLPFSHRLAADFWTRLVAFDYQIDAAASAYAQLAAQDITDPAFIQQKSAYYYVTNLLSVCFRGEVLQRLDPEIALAIIGGDPGYLTEGAGDRALQQPNITYHPPTRDYSTTQHLYAHTRINLNITSLQFDQAVVNRVIDVAAVGGFILTDWKSDLSKLTTVADQISYRSLPELNAKIAYYLAHDSERLELAAQLQRDVMAQCSYDRVITQLLTQLKTMPNVLDSALPAVPEIIRVDLGCGIHKPEGFIGVDVSAGPGVDIVADLNQRFPFPDNSVDILRAHDVVEHLSDRLHTMNEIWRICKPGAQVDIRVPSTDGRGAFQDPTHVSFWNINSFNYYCVEFPNYLALCHSYGFNGQFEVLHLSDEPVTPDLVIHTRALLQVIKSGPLEMDETGLQGIQPADSSTSSLLNSLPLQATNLLLVPDWQQPEEQLQSSLLEILRASAQYPDRKNITLCLDSGNFPTHTGLNLEDVVCELLLSLLLTDGIDIANEGPGIAILPSMSRADFAELLPRINYRLTFAQDNLDRIASLGIMEVPTCDLNTLNQGQLKA